MSLHKMKAQVKLPLRKGPKAPNSVVEGHMLTVNFGRVSGAFPQNFEYGRRRGAWGSEAWQGRRRRVNVIL